MKLNILFSLLLIACWMGSSMTLKTKEEFDLCVNKQKCEDMTLWEALQVSNFCICWTSQNVNTMRSKEEITIDTIQDYEKCYDDCSQGLTDAQNEQFDCKIECMKDDDYEKEKAQYELYGSLVAGVILILIGFAIWRCCCRKEERIIVQQQPQIQQIQPLQPVQVAQPVAAQQQVVQPNIYTQTVPVVQQQQQQYTACNDQSSVPIYN